MRQSRAAGGGESPSEDHGGTLVDLGCGSARLLARFARGRPDARVIGLDLSDPMLETGRDLLEREGLGGERVELRRGDITSFDTDLPERPDVPLPAGTRLPYRIIASSLPRSLQAA